MGTQIFVSNNINNKTYKDYYTYSLKSTNSKPIFAEQENILELESNLNIPGDSFTMRIHKSFI